MNMIVERFNKIKSNILKLQPSRPVNIVAVSKTFPLSHCQMIGHYHTTMQNKNG